MSRIKKIISKKGEGGFWETVISVLICALLLLFPMLLIEHEYKMFTQTHGEAIEGAAGSALALAVVFRTVSRTVLRTIIRTSARAGMRASLKGALRAGIRAASRSQSMSFIKGSSKEPVGDDASLEEIRRSNYKSLCFASVLLFLSPRHNLLRFL